MEDRRWIKGRWVEHSGERRRRFYSLTNKGREALDGERRAWQEFTRGVNLVLEPSNA
jgi:DNA-binding PadR family transcriptional regulator